MEPIILFGAIVAIIAGFLDGIEKSKKSKYKVKSSSNLISFIFLDPFNK